MCVVFLIIETFILIAKFKYEKIKSKKYVIEQVSYE